MEQEYVIKTPPKKAVFLWPKTDLLFLCDFFFRSSGRVDKNILSMPTLGFFLFPDSDCRPITTLGRIEASSTGNRWDMGGRVRRDDRDIEPVVEEASILM